MSNICGNDGLKIRIFGKSKIRGFATKFCKVRARSRVKCLFSAKVSVIFQGFPIGSGRIGTNNNFGSANFGDTGRRQPPQILVRSISGVGNVRVNTTKQTIRKSIPNLPKTIFDITSQEYIDYGFSSVPNSVYSPFDSNNSTVVNSRGPLIEHGLITERKRKSNSRLLANLGRPVNNMKVKITGVAKVKSKFFEKLHGHTDRINSFDNFVPTEKLYPIRDINNKKNGISFVTERTKTNDIYESINEGIHTGNITKHGAKGSIISDDINSFITPSSIYTEGEFTYKCEVNAPTITPRETFLFIRASAPLTNFDSDIPPTYEVSNIKLEDPYGNLIAKYKDFTIKGEQDYSEKNHHHYITYVTEPEINHAAGHTWDYYYPVLGEDSGYTLSLDIKGNCFFHAFEEDAFNKGFQDGCNLDDKFVQSSKSDYLAIDGSAFSTQSKNYFVRPTDALRISALEINNKGSVSGILHDNKLNMFLDVVPTGLLLERTLRPQRVLSTDYTNNIYPTNTINVWETSPDIDGNTYDNTIDAGKNNYELKDRLGNEYVEGHITLIDTSPVPASGKLQLFYSHQNPKRVKAQLGGALNIGNRYEGAFARPELKTVFPDDSYFIVEELFLRVKIKKASTQADFPIDVVGYSNDGVMISTKQVGGFLQNASSGVGTVPLTTGFDNINELGLSAETMSDKFAYYSRPVTSNPAGDHYRLEDSVIVTNSSDFQTYDVPLKIYEDNVELGRSRDYTHSRLFEALYLDIYPIPSGTEISKADLIIKYKPAAALALNTLGCSDVRIGPAFSLLSPIKSSQSDSNDGYILSNLPHAYETKEPTLKTNYAKRWRGSSGLVSAGPFDADGFGFGFEYPQLDMPFTSGYYNFSDINGTAINATQSSSLVGQLSNSNMSNNIVRNIGMRFRSDSLFPPPTEPPAPVTEDGFDLSPSITYNYHVVGNSNGLNSANAITVRIPDEYDNRADDTDKTYVTPTLFTANYDGNARLYNHVTNAIGIAGLWTLSVLVNDQHVGDIFTEQNSFSSGNNEFVDIDIKVGDEIALSGVTTSVHHVADEFNLVSEYVGIHMNTYAPSYYKPYKTINWTESGHELEDNIVDAFDHAVRASGADGYINFGDVDTADGFAIFMRFSPDITVSGVNPDYNLWNSGVLFHKQDVGQDLEFGLKYNYGKLQAYAQDDLGSIISIEDTTDYTEYQYPLSVLVTYNANRNEKLKLYTHNEMATGDWTRLRAESDVFNLNDGNSDLTFAYDKENDIGFNAFISEIGISHSHPQGGSNIVDATPEKSYSQDTTDAFFDGHTTLHDDSNPLWQFVDDKTTEWDLGEFKYCGFGRAFDIMTARNGEDFIYHTYYNDGLDYAGRTDINFPESLAHASGLAYHSQVENDMLRFSVGGKSEQFYAIRPRIVRSFPRSYMLAEDALRVNTVLQHYTDDDIIWPDGNKGAKLIVSLYTPAKESILTPTKNYGLINRSTHYVNPEDCWTKLRSVFTLSDIKDKDSEPWAFFDTTITKNELAENYFSKEIDDMFIQYDLVYPSGDYTESKITIHSLDVSLHDALTKEATVTEHLLLHSSGAFMQESDVNLFSDAKGIENDYLWLNSSGIAYTPSSGELRLFSSGTFNHTNDLMLMQPDVYATANTDNSESNFGSLFGSNITGLRLLSEGGNPNAYQDISLYSAGTAELVSANATLPLNLLDYDNPNTLTSTFDLFVYSAPAEYTPSYVTIDAGLSLYSLAPPQAPIPFDASINLFLEATPIILDVDSSIPLFLYHKKPINSGPNQLEAFTWNGDNYGSAIDVVDNSLASISADNEIRGVNTVCYGSCDSGHGLTCTEVDIYTHDTLWNSSLCTNGGVARSLRTYTNPDVNAFGSDEPYDNHYYGFRKITNLIPLAPYNITLTGRTGSGKILEVPREIKEWEYGFKNASTGDPNKDINYTGLKLTAPVSNVENNQNFGKSVTVLDDKVIIGAPFEDIPVGVDDTLNNDTENYNIADAGKIYIYKKAPEATGSDWTDQNDKAPFVLEQELVLPTGFRRDYFYETTQQFSDDGGNTLDFSATIRNWVNVGEGRQLGHSLDSASRGDKEVIVAGGPGTLWTRQFTPVSTTPVKIALMVFNNELITNPPVLSWQSIMNELQGRDILYRYFSDPPVEFDIEIMLVEPLLGLDLPFTESEDFNYPQPDFVTKHLTNRHYSFDYNSQEYKDQEAIILDELKNIYHSRFPLDATALHNGIPPLFGIYIDNSRSLGTRALGYFDDNLRSGAINKFIDYVKDYSYANGLTYFNGAAASTEFNVTVKTDEDWITQSIVCLKDLTDQTRLKNSGGFNLIANDIGTFNSNASEFNYPPPSGGSVFVFEKDKDASNFELVQHIESTSTYNDDVSDRFGHDVAISDDGKIIAIGSPFCEDAVQIWEYDLDFETRLDQYIVSGSFTEFLRTEHQVDRLNETFGEAYLAYERYITEVVNTSSPFGLLRDIYSGASETLKYKFILYIGLTPYNKIKTMSYSSLFSGGGSWGRLYSRYVPTARLGYSVDVNADGSLVAIGSPTDSLGERDNLVTWFRYDQAGGQVTGYGGSEWQWQNYTNAGAVRLLESRDYYPHSNKVVEYYKFGNKHETLAPEEDSELFFTSMRNLFSSRGYEFSRTSFAEDKKIPQDAGLAFIITPEIDASSDEIINNIREWLAYGDRHLVIVADDPLYEQGGAYQDTNTIVNYLLKSLDINLRVYPARNRYDALLEDTGLFFNVRQSYVPSKTTNSISETALLRGSGVADIRFYDEGRADLYNCTLPYGTRKSSDPFAILEQIDGVDANAAGRKLLYRELHDKCELPIIHEGDLRAKYTDQCIYRSCKGETAFINYQHNLAFMYGSHTTCNDWGCTVCDEVCPPVLNVNDREASEPMPIMTAYESLVKTIHVDATPDREQIVKELVGYRESEPGETIYDFTDIAYSGIEFMWSADSGNYSALDYNMNNIVSQSLFFDPEEYNGEDAILLSKASVPYETLDKIVTVSPTFDYCTEERFEAVTNASVVLIAGTYTEKKESLVLSENDANLNFYFNILAKDVNGSCKVAQVGGFTQRTSYKDGYSESDIQIQMLGLGIDMQDTNVLPNELYDISKNYDVAWIANSKEYPSDQDINDLKKFLRMSNKKLVITYGQDPDDTTEPDEENPEAMSASLIRQAQIAEYICEKLNLTMKPRFLQGFNVYASPRNVRGNWSQIRSTITVHDQSYVYAGFPTDPNTRIEEFHINNPPFYRGRGVGYNHDIIGIERNSASSIAYFNASVSDEATEEQGVPTFNTGITKVTFDVKPPKEDQDKFNLFKLFFNISSQSALESSPLEVFINNCSTEVSHPSAASSTGVEITVEDDGDVGEAIQTKIKAGYYQELVTSNNLTKAAFIQVPSGVDSFDIFITGTRAEYKLQPNPEYLRTNRLVSISGVRVRALEEVPETSKIPIYEEKLITLPGSDAYSYNTDLIREISNSSTQYCFSANSDVCAEDSPAGYGTEGNSPDIADGPMVVAQAVYHQGGFFSGHNKSRVTVISDASLIQGRTTLLEDGLRVNPELVNFLTGLYPRTTFASERSGRQYETEYKIISPERSSPSRLINAYPENSGLNHRFGQYPTNELALNQYSDDEGKKQVLAVPPNDFVRQPFDAMLGLMEAMDPGKFRKLPEELEIPPGERFALMKPPSAGAAARQAYEQAWYVDNFEPVQAAYGSKTKLHDTYNGVAYEDAGYRDLIPPMLRETGHDHLDLKVFNSGYPGDLFGYKVTLHKDKLYVGAPFAVYNGENEIVTWADVINKSSEGIYGTEIGFNGGAGAVYVVERTGVVGTGVGSINRSQEITDGIPWDVTQKFRPEEINVGFSGINTTNSNTLIGPNTYSNDFLESNAHVSDMFGYDIALNGDILAISAPGHDFETFFEHTPGTFMRKEFNEQFSIPKVNSTDLGSSANRGLLPGSGDVVINHGAVFTYENRIDNWGDKSQRWSTIHKVVGQGYNTRVQNSGENTFFGSAIALDRARRNDSDYILAIGANNHLYSNNDNTEVPNGGATYAYDGMLRKLRPAFSHPDTFISGRVFGSIPDKVDMKFNFSNGQEADKMLLFDGRVHSDRQGQIFIEVSGQDKLDKGYVIHRPYIEQIKGGYAFGKAEVATMPLISDGRYAPFSGVLPLISLAPNTASVYNNVNLIMQRDLQTSGELRLYTSGNNMFGDTPISFVDDPDAIKDLETNIANINNVAFLVARGGFRNG
tara:strand:- start:484 stop:13125 length:12642 start_codon:yes stop_codon:yes gene_type:complete